jgi:hypothetical protein
MSPFDPIDFKPLVAKETNGRMHVCLMAFCLIKQAVNRGKTAKNLYVSRHVVIVNEWVKRFYQHGMKA